MDTETALTLTGGFFKLMADVLYEVKRDQAADLDREFVRLKRKHVDEAYNTYLCQYESEIRKKKALVSQDLINHGLGNSTIRQSIHASIDRDAEANLDRVGRQYSYVIEELALTERKAKSKSLPWWERIYRLLK
jgi:hypothetical protein